MSVAAQEREITRPDVSLGPVTWARRNLFNTWYNALLTIFALWLIYRVLAALIPWLLTANWAPILSRPLLYLVGQYPQEELWRVAIGLAFFSFLFGVSWGTWGGVVRTFALALAAGYGAIALLPVSLEVISLAARLFLLGNIALVLAGFGLGEIRPLPTRWLLAGWLLGFIAFIVLLRGIPGSALLEVVQTTRWGGLMVNLMVAAIGIVASFPIGVLLALGRRSDLPVLKGFSVLFIELVRGVPLVSLLFMGSVILPLFLPQEIRIDRLVRALIAITLFSAAYMAENVRGGLQAIPEGQYEAARAIGLNGPQMTFLIVLPQALRLVIPAIVGQFISLFKDTTLLVIVSIIEILGIAKAVVSGNPQWIGAQAEVYLFVAAVFWVFTYGMSYSSRRLERALGVGVR